MDYPGTYRKRSDGNLHSAAGRIDGNFGDDCRNFGCGYEREHQQLEKPHRHHSIRSLGQFRALASSAGCNECDREPDCGSRQRYDECWR